MLRKEGFGSYVNNPGVDPNAPAGGGGPGYFRGNRAPGILRSPSQPLFSSGAVLLARRGGVVVPACSHVQDPGWKIDLLWHYLHEKRAAPLNWKHDGSSLFDGWYKTVDPKAFENRHRVYELLVDSPADTKPLQQDESRIPWNQLHKNWVPKNGKYACGTITKMFLCRYMTWTKYPEHDLLTGGKLDGSKVDKNFVRIVSQLRKNLPVVVKLKTVKDLGGAGKHYVGIVGYDGDKKFLHIEPWSTTNGTIKYAGTNTSVLGIIKYKKGAIMEYTQGPYFIVGVQSPF